MERIAIFDESLTGHNLEYLHILYEMALNDNENMYYFIVHHNFWCENQEMSWPSKFNIIVFPMTEDETLGCTSSNMFKQSYQISKTIKKYLNDNKINKVFLVSLIRILPLGVFILPRKIKISGIIYSIYLYRWHTSSIVIRIQDIIKYLLFTVDNKFKWIYILNDSSSADVLCRVWHTKKYIKINDPFTPPIINYYSIRQKFNIKPDQKIFYHFSIKDLRTGAIEVLLSLQFLTEEEKSKYVFLFSGIVKPEIREQFYKLKENLLLNNVNLIVIDNYVSYEFIACACKDCDCILLPYVETRQSSSALGQAAFYEKPVIGPKSGLVGKLIKKYRLGVNTQISPFHLYDSYKQVFEIKYNTSLYKKEIVKEKFQNLIRQGFS